MRLLLLPALVACSGDAAPLRSADPATAVQVDLQVEGVRGAAPPLDVWVSRGLDDRVAEGRARAGTVSLPTPAGTWEVWVASAFPATTDTGAPVQCSGHAQDVVVEPGATTVVTVAVRCASGG